MKGQCPHIRSRRYGEDESIDYCELTERPSGRIQVCLLVGGNECETWEEIKKEWANE